MRSNHSLSKERIPVGVERKLLEDWQDDYQSWICLGDPKLASSYSKQRREAAEWVGTSPPTYTPPCVRAGRHRLHSSQVTNVPKAVAAPWSNYAFHASNGWLSNIGHTRIVMWTAECSIQCETRPNCFHSLRELKCAYQCFSLWGRPGGRSEYVKQTEGEKFAFRAKKLLLYCVCVFYIVFSRRSWYEFKYVHGNPNGASCRKSTKTKAFPIFAIILQRNKSYTLPKSRSPLKKKGPAITWASSVGPYCNAVSGLWWKNMFCTIYIHKYPKSSVKK